MPNGKLTLDEGLISVRLDPLGMIDAAVSGEIAAIELEVKEAHVHIGERTDYRSALTLSMDMRPHTLERIVYHVAHKVGLTVLPSGTPAFNEREWRTITDALRFSTRRNFRDRHVAIDLAERIEKAYGDEPTAEQRAADPARYDDPRGEHDR
jgi:hypothetical protein